jgi:sensor histidine kinase YesM
LCLLIKKPTILQSPIQENIIPKILKRRWMWHAAFWAIYFIVALPAEIGSLLALPAEVAEVNQFSKIQVNLNRLQVVAAMILEHIDLIIYAYIALWYLYPRFFSRQRYALFFTYGIVLAMFINAVEIKLDGIISPFLVIGDWFNIYLSNLSIYPLFLFLVTMCKFFKDSLIQQELNNQELFAAKQAELNNLKAQLSPHFLFNTMNNFYGLAVTQSKQLPDLMLRLSELMRYSLYGTNRSTVPLEDEIRYLKNYVELEKIRLEATLQLSVHSEFAGYEALGIAPLILIVFVENAFKHSRNIQNEPIDIQINLHFAADDWLIFKVKNNYAPQVELYFDDLDAAGGIGLENVKKRLEAIYPNGLHELTFEKDDHYFQVELKIKLA